MPSTRDKEESLKQSYARNAPTRTTRRRRGRVNAVETRRAQKAAGRIARARLIVERSRRARKARPRARRTVATGFAVPASDAIGRSARHGARYAIKTRCALPSWRGQTERVAKGSRVAFRAIGSGHERRRISISPLGTFDRNARRQRAIIALWTRCGERVRRRRAAAAPLARRADGTISLRDAARCSAIGPGRARRHLRARARSRAHITRRARSTQRIRALEAVGALNTSQARGRIRRRLV